VKTLLQLAAAAIVAAAVQMHLPSRLPLQLPEQGWL
jgi:hypothetical protein